MQRESLQLQVIELVQLSFYQCSATEIVQTSQSETHPNPHHPTSRPSDASTSTRSRTGSPVTRVQQAAYSSTCRR